MSLTLRLFLNNHNGICPKKPCTTLATSISGRLSPWAHLPYPNFVAFNLQPSVQVIKSIPKVTFLDLINNVGSSSGLWIGASMFSLFEMFQAASMFCFHSTVIKYLSCVAAVYVTLSCIFLGFIVIFLSYKKH